MKRHNLTHDYMINKPCGHHFNGFSVMDLSCSSSFDPKSKLCFVLVICSNICFVDYFIFEYIHTREMPSAK